MSNVTVSVSSDARTSVVFLNGKQKCREQYMSEFDELPHEQQLMCLQHLAEASLDRFALSAGASARLINLSENATYKVEIPQSPQCWALRVHREGYHTGNAIASELAWAKALRQSKAAITPVVVPGLDGEDIQTVSHTSLPTPRHVVLFEWESGIEPSEEDDDLRAPFEVLGETAARMHAHVKSWELPQGFERLTWDFETSLGATPHWGRWRDGMGLDQQRQQLFGETVDLIAQRLDNFGKSPDRFGLIHCDMRLANLLIDGDITKVIDFDDCGFSWLMYDCATTVSFFENRPEVPDLLTSWVKGYRKIIDLPAEDEAEIPTFVMLRRLLLVAWIGSHSQTDLAQSMGVTYSHQTDALCRNYLAKFG
jgi:Ser/Thr protein kinase RdoA (MazF antagonist)